MRKALTARFRRAPLLRQRMLLVLRYPVHVKDVPDGLIGDVVKELQWKS
jgi:hypothetical protein